MRCTTPPLLSAVIDRLPVFAAHVQTTGPTAERQINFRAVGLPRVRRLMLMPYGGYANDSRLTIRGRVLREHKTTQAQPHTSAWRNFVALVRLLNSTEVPGAEVCAQFRSREYKAVA